MIRRPPRSTRTDTLFPTRRSSDLPSIVRGAVDAITDYGSLHWSCARTRLSFALLRDLEAEISQLFRARVVAFSRSEEHTSELQSLMRISYAVFCLKKKNKTRIQIEE